MYALIEAPTFGEMCFFYSCPILVALFLTGWRLYGFVLLISNCLHELETAARHYRVGKTIAMLRSGNITVYTSNCLHELGTAARHCRV